MEDTHRNREEVWRISELLKIFKRQANKYEGFLKYGRYLKRKVRNYEGFLWRIFKRKVQNYEGFSNYGRYLKEKWRIVKDF